MTQSEQDNEHLRLLSLFHYIAGGAIAVFSCIPIIHMVVGLVLMLSPQSFGPPGSSPPPAWFGVLFVILGGGIIACGVTLATLVFFGGRFLARRTHYTFCLVVAGLSCLFMPIGTALGVFTIIVLMRPSVKPLFH